VLLAGLLPSIAFGYDALEVKAALVGKVADFVTWPPEAGLGDPDRPLELVVLGKTPLEPRLRELYERRQVRIAGHRVSIRQTPDPGAIGRPHLLFIAPGLSDGLEEVLRGLGRQPILTVSDTEGFGRRGVAVNLFDADRRVRFELSLEAMRRHGLQPSYRLLGMARIVDGGPRR
jgi:hypothetical protein